MARKSKHDPVSNPSHYTTHPSGIECIDVAEHMPFNRGNAIKYIWRAGKKDGADELDDLRKAAWYVAREILRIKQQRLRESAEYVASEVAKAERIHKRAQKRKAAK